ncbi:MAG: extracellular solute-binding protein [Clostridiales bacterium]|nr:extracellular solute-binding protein [Clostridiales bacterium]
MSCISKRILAATMAVTMVVPLVSCKRKKKPVKEIISESDPYFFADVVELEVSPDTDKIVESQSITAETLVDDKVIASYAISYEMPADIWDGYDETEMTPEEIDAFYDMYNEYYVQGVGVFGLDGKMISTIDIDSNLQITCISEGQNGEILIMADEYQYFDDYDAYAIKNIIYKFNQDGKQVGRVRLPDDVDFYPNYVCQAANGDYVISTYGEFAVVTKNGTFVGSFTDENMQGELFVSGEDVYVSSIESSADYSSVSRYLVKLDLEKGEYTDKKVALDYYYYNMCSDGQNGMVVITGAGIEKFDIQTGKMEEYLKWDSTDVNYNNISSIRFYSEDCLSFIREEWKQDSETGEWGEKVYISTLTRAEKNPHAGKTYIEMGMIGSPGTALMDYIVSYNASKENKARMRVRDYSVEGEESTITLKQFNAISDQVYQEMLAGNGPDILVDFSGYSQFNSENVLEDLNKYIDGENGFNREEYFDNVLSAFETREKLFHVPVCFDIRGLLGNKEMVGERSGWTYPEFQQIVETLDPQVSVFEPKEYSLLLESLLSNSMSNFIDYEKKVVYFDGDEFKQLLQIAKQYGVAEIPTDPGSDPVYESGVGLVLPEDGIRAMMEEGLLALMDTYIYRVDQYAENASLLNGNVVYVGMPSPDGTGMAAAPMLTMAISAFSNNKEEAWDFIRRMFDEDAQFEYTTSYTSIPLNRRAFDRVNETILKESQESYDYYLELASEYGWFLDELPTRITTEHVEGFRELVENVSTIQSTDLAVLDIINEEAAAFFADQKSIDEVCKNIQNRTTTIVNER